MPYIQQGVARYDSHIKVCRVEELDNSLHYWKNYTFSDSYIKLDDAVETISTDQPLVEGRQDYPGRWVMSAPFDSGSQRCLSSLLALQVWH
ncbi:hypothetical protein OH77DRAFT_1215261 [Trametes cingulata]|nr:hypothetical protein OH77DRAFT_1215261 [Trametes cingulata]